MISILSFSLYLQHIYNTKTSPMKCLFYFIQGLRNDKMKFLLSFFISFFCITLSAKDIGHSEADTIKCMRQIVCDSLAFKGKAIGVVFDKFKEYGIPIRSITFGGTSPWIDPEGVSYLDRITISCYDDDETTLRIYQERPFCMVVIYIDGSKMPMEEAMGRFPMRSKGISIETKLDMLRGLFGVKHLHFVFMFNYPACIPKEYYE